MVDLSKYQAFTLMMHNIPLIDSENISQAITPNGDGKNDTWIIDKIEQYPNAKLSVLNRWGEEVFNALQANINGFENTAVGDDSLASNIGGSQNVAVGGDTLSDNISGWGNTAIGRNTGGGITTGSNNTILGASVTGLAAGLSNNIIIADGAGNQRIRVLANGDTTIDGSLTLTAGKTFFVGTTSLTVPDYVFESYFDEGSSLNPTYRLLSLEEIEEFVKTNNHLPGVQSHQEAQVAGKWDITENTRVNLEKIEELYLHTIEQQKQIEAQSNEIEELKLMVNQLLEAKQ